MKLWSKSWPFIFDSLIHAHKVMNTAAKEAVTRKNTWWRWDGWSPGVELMSEQWPVKLDKPTEWVSILTLTDFLQMLTHARIQILGLDQAFSPWKSLLSKKTNKSGLCENKWGCLDTTNSHIFPTSSLIVQHSRKGWLIGHWTKVKSKSSQYVIKGEREE